ncbi:MAG TPA: c-type cytochrome [Waddliaceae bacterium]
MYYHNTFLAILVLGMGIAFTIGPSLWPKGEESKKREEFQTDTSITLLDPEMAPPEIKPLVMQGFNQMLDSKKYMPEYANDGVNCTNCHFAAGNTLGGTNNGISLVGAINNYPIILPENKTVTIENRINGCFTKSMNGKPLPVGSQEMLAIVAYLTWISSPAKDISVTWLGLKPLHSQHTPNPHNGAELFSIHCAACHGDSGEGQRRSEQLSYPALWGPHAFNAPEGMNRFPVLASFLYFNMPYENPFLTAEEALDIAAYLVSQSHSQFKAKKQLAQ